MILGVVTSTGDTDTLKDSKWLARGGDDEYNGRQVVIYDAAGSIVDGESSFVSDFAAATYEATMLPVFTANITILDKYEMWRTFWKEEINEAINQAIMDVTDDCLQIKQTTNTYTDDDEYEYNCLSDFVGLYKVEYEYDSGIEHILHNCDVAWDELVDGDVTATADTTLKWEGSASAKLVVAAGCGAGDILATDSISALNISDCNKVQVTVYSTVALDAGDIQLLLDNTASCASPVESLNIPATTANTKTTHVIALANPESDSAIISVGLKMVTDKGAFTLYADKIRAFKSTSKEYRVLNPEMWSIVKDSTNYLKLTPEALGLIGDTRQLRLTGYQIPALLTAEATASEVDPSWLIAKVTGRLLIGHAKSSRLDILDREKLSKYWFDEAEKRMPHIRTMIANNTRWVI